MGSIEAQLDVLIVGAGFSGVSLLHTLRKLGYSTKVFEAGADFGGVWFWNCYPGARVDSHVPLYEFSNEELWRDWTWTEKFPGWKELREYFHYVDSKQDLRKDVSFNTRVVAAHFDGEVDRWIVKTEDGKVAHPRFLLLCTGFAAKPYTPPLKGLDKFEGICHHSSKWPQEGVDLKGKQVAIIGTGATGVQIIQEIGPEVGHLTVFQRTPNIALPMRQAKLDKETQNKRKSIYPVIYRRRLQTNGGYDESAFGRDYNSVSPEQRLLHLEHIWERGAFYFILQNFQDFFTNEDTNHAVYDFWRDKVRERIRDPETQEILAPTVPPHPLGAKRACLEQTYYEVYNQPNVKLVDLEKTSISEITSDAIQTSDGAVHKVDAIVLATGFDAVTGGITQIDIRGLDGTTIKEKWDEGCATYLGMTTANFPNMFFTYGPEAPTAFSNGPSTIEVQVEWIVNTIEYMTTNRLTRIEATRESELGYRTLVDNISSMTLLSKAKSWYMGANIPGKKVQQLNFPGGIPLYQQMGRDVAEKGYEGFKLSSVGDAEPKVHSN